MLTSQRKALILSDLRQHGQVLAKDFAQRLGLSEDTIRRDLRELAAEGRLQRVHGGALPVTPDLPDLKVRQTIASEAKSAIGRAAAKLVEPGMTVFLDGGTTTAAIARALPDALNCTVATHAPTIAVALEDKPEITLELIGGRLYRHSMVATGAEALDAIRRIRADIYFMGVTGIHPQAGFTTGDRDEAALKRAISLGAKRTVALMTRDKLDAVSPFVIVAFDAVATLLAAPDIEADSLAGYRATGIEVIVA